MSFCCISVWHPPCASNRPSHGSKVLPENSVAFSWRRSCSPLTYDKVDTTKRGHFKSFLSPGRSNDRRNNVSLCCKCRVTENPSNIAEELKDESRNQVEQDTDITVRDAAEGSRAESKKRFVSWFREAWPYIQGHRSSTFVIVMPGDVLVNRKVADGILQDVALLHGLGMRIVLVLGVRNQIDALLRQRGLTHRFSGGYRVTDRETLEAAMAASGRVHLDVEAKLSRGLAIPALRRHGENNRWHEAGVSVASGNYVAAKRRGVVGGVDFGLTGEVRKVDVDGVAAQLASGSVVLLGNLGYSSVGEVLNCAVVDVASVCATALNADKLLIFLDGPLLDASGKRLHHVSLKEADAMLEAEHQRLAATSAASAAAGAAAADAGRRNGVATAAALPGVNGSSFSRDGAGPATNGAAAGPGSDGGRLRHAAQLAAAVQACKGGVRRVHLLDSNREGILLLELYTRDGVGAMLSNDMYAGTRQAQVKDVLGIKALLQPLEDAGTLVRRSPEQIEEVVDSFKVVEKDGDIVACAALIPYPSDRCAEVAAFVVSPACRGQGRGDALLDYLEKLGADMGLGHLFLLTTRTADWFVQRGFAQCELSYIPEAKLRKMDLSRGSKAFMKVLPAQTATTKPWSRGGRQS